MAERAKATVTEVEASHASPVSQPDAIARVIITAAQQIIHAGVKHDDLQKAAKRVSAGG
jgi:hypothetical protein